MKKQERSSTAALAAWFGVLSLPLTATAQPIRLEIPIACELGVSCVVQNYVDHDPSRAAADYQCGTLTYDRHDGTDFRLATTAAQRAGVNVLAAADGVVLRIRDGVADSMLRPGEQYGTPERACGNGVVISHPDGWETQYCHLAKGSIRVRAGDRVVATQPIALVGLSGYTQFAHLHISVRQQGKIVDPFAFGAPTGSCGGGTSLWSKRASTALAYRERFVLNAGFATGPVKMEQIELGQTEQASLTADSSALVAFVRSIGLKAGDEQRLVVVGPDGRKVAERSEKALDSPKAQFMLFVGIKRPDAGWPSGSYRATYVVTNNEKITLEREFSVSRQH